MRFSNVGKSLLGMYLDSVELMALSVSKSTYLGDVKRQSLRFEHGLRYSLRDVNASDSVDRRHWLKLSLIYKAPFKRSSALPETFEYRRCISLYTTASTIDVYRYPSTVPAEYQQVMNFELLSSRCQSVCRTCY
jgi:hypothetical protein